MRHSQATTSIGSSGPAECAIGLGRALTSEEKIWPRFEARWKKLDPARWPIPKQVDYKLIGSALSRVRWELEINPRWKRDPNFYIEQTLTALAEALTIPAPYDEARSREILTRIENIPSILQQGLENLENPPAPFASVAVQKSRRHSRAPAHDDERRSLDSPL